MGDNWAISVNGRQLVSSSTYAELYGLLPFVPSRKAHHVFCILLFLNMRHPYDINYDDDVKVTERNNSVVVILLG